MKSSRVTRVVEGRKRNVERKERGRSEQRRGARVRSLMKSSVCLLGRILVMRVLQAEQVLGLVGRKKRKKWSTRGNRILLHC